MISRARLDQALVARGLVSTRSQAESYIKLGQVQVNGRRATKASQLILGDDKLTMSTQNQYVSRAGLKLASVADVLRLDFRGKTVLDVGSSTGGFTDYALRHGATKVIAVDVGTAQLHPSLHNNPRIELHEQTDIREFKTSQPIDLVIADVSFISLREILPTVSQLIASQAQIVAMVKPQFEAGTGFKHKGIIKNDKMRREILKDFELWVAAGFKIVAKADSQVSGAHGNLERFYLLMPTAADTVARS